jgi:hypothetical protein
MAELANEAFGPPVFGAAAEAAEMHPVTSGEMTQHPPGTYRTTDAGRIRQLRTEKHQILHDTILTAVIGHGSW